MTRRASVAGLIFALATCASAQPGIRQNGVVNAASLIPPTLPGGVIARGALFTIHGVRLGSAGHTTVTVSQNGSATPVTALKIDARRIDALMPKSAPAGSSALVVTVDGQASKPFPMEVAASNPGIFSRNGEGWGPGRIDNIAPSGSRSPNSIANPARPGQRVRLVTTGLGDRKQARVIIGNRAARAGPPHATGEAGEEAITFQLPHDAPRGCYVPVYLQAAPARASNVVTITIGSGSGPCDAGPVPLLSSEGTGIVVLSRTRIKARRSNIADEVEDDARITFNKTASEPVLTPLRLLPPAGSCTAYTSSFQADTDLSTSISSILGPGGEGLDAGGKLMLTGAGSSRSIGESWGNPGSYRAHLGSASLDRRGPALFLEPGQFVLRGTGGKDVGPFRASFRVPTPFDWVDRDQISVVDRSQGVTVHWRGATRDQLMAIVARNVDQITTAIGLCVCVAPASSGQFPIPAVLLANVPTSRDIPGTPFDELVIGALSSKLPSIQASGLSGGFVVSIYATGRIVEYR
ncbi:MAG TPA: IPT/TIG domain-containing protein, partial [Bryobacteraceae bacterium]|nr:IPT/TIG domain-containing protein [Bryobacteraceae bacterium]